MVNPLIHTLLLASLLLYFSADTVVTRSVCVICGEQAEQGNRIFLTLFNKIKTWYELNNLSTKCRIIF